MAESLSTWSVQGTACDGVGRVAEETEKTEETKLRKLTNKQRVWLEHYLTCWNASEAAREAAYERPHQSGYENLSKPYIKERIRRRLAARHITAEEVIAWLSDQARGDIGDFFTEGGRFPILDWEKIFEKGLTHLIKSITPTKWGTKIELYSSKDALELLAKHFGLQKEQVAVDVTSGGEKLADATDEGRLVGLMALYDRIAKKALQQPGGPEPDLDPEDPGTG